MRTSQKKTQIKRASTNLLQILLYSLTSSTLTIAAPPSNPPPAAGQSPVITVPTTPNSNQLLSCNQISGPGQRALCQVASGMTPQALIDNLQGKGETRLDYGSCQINVLTSCPECSCSVYLTSRKLNDSMGHSGYPNVQGDLGSNRYNPNNYSTGCVASTWKAPATGSPTPVCYAGLNPTLHPTIRPIDPVRRPSECIQDPLRWQEEFKSMFLSTLYDIGDPCELNSSRIRSSAQNSQSSERVFGTNVRGALRRRTVGDVTQFYVRVPAFDGMYCPVNNTLANSDGPYKFLINRAKRTLERMNQTEKTQLAEVSSADILLAKVCLPDGTHQPTVRAAYHLLTNYFSFLVPSYPYQEATPQITARRTALTRLRNGAPQKQPLDAKLSAQLIECDFHAGTVSWLVNVANAQAVSSNACYKISQIKPWIDYLRTKMQKPGGAQSAWEKEKDDHFRDPTNNYTSP